MSIKNYLYVHIFFTINELFYYIFHITPLVFGCTSGRDKKIPLSALIKSIQTAAYTGLPAL